jgi:hypothetical protein
MNQRNRKKRLKLRPSQATPAPLAADKAGEAPQEAVLEMLEHGAADLRRMERLLAENNEPGMEQLVSLHRRLVLGLCARTDDPETMLQLADSAMKLLIGWARIEEKRKDREFAERKFKEQQTARARDAKAADSGLPPELLQEIQRELNLF